MLRRTLILFVAFVLLILAVTVGYALLGLSGPRTAIADADKQIAASRLADAVRLLDIAERTLTAKEQGELLPEILRRRFRAHRKLGNIPAARRDLEALLELLAGQPKDPELGVAHVEILLAAGQPQAALDAAAAQLDDTSGRAHARLLEVMGEAHQALYQRITARLIASLEGALGTENQRVAVRLLQTVLYREAQDPVAQHARNQLYDLLRRTAAAPLSIASFERGVDDARSGIQQAMQRFRQCLECAGAEPVAALHGLAYGLEMAGRHDERRAIEDLYLRRFDHPETVRAAITAAEAHLAAGHYREVVQLAQRFLPPGTALARVEADRFPPATKRLMVAHARALLELADADGLNRLAADANAVHSSDLLAMTPELCLIQACAMWHHGTDGARDQLKTLLWMVGSERPKSRDALDLYEIGIDLLLRWWRARDDASQIEATLDGWCKARPDDVRARRARCEHLLATGRTELALADAAELLRHPSRDEASLQLYVRAVDRAAASSGRDAAQVLAKMAARGTTQPSEPHDPALYLALGDLAQRQGLPWTASRCGYLAARTFPWAEWPRRLAAEASLQIRQPAEALRAAETYRELFPDSTTALQFYREALAQTGRSEPDLLFTVATHGLPDPELARTLLNASIARDQRSLLPALARRTMYRFGQDAQVMLRAALALLAVNQTQTARDLLLRIPAAFPADHEACVEAATRFLLLEARANPRSPLLGLAVDALRTHARGDTETLVRVATELEEAGQPALVLAVLAPLLDNEEYRNERTGPAYALAGRASLALDRPARAEEFLTRAVAFPDGADAAPSLALLWTLQKRHSEAESAMWQKEAKDEASACLLLRMERPDSAVRWARGRQREVSFDVTAMLILALAGTADDKRSVTADFKAFARAEGKAALNTITLLAMPGFQVLGCKAAQELHERLPQSAIAWFLYARGLALTGKRDAAVNELTELTQKAPSFLPAYEEVLRITDGGRRGDISQIGPRISSSVISAPNLATPRMRAMVGQAFATHVGMAHNDPASALPLLARLWIQFPNELRAGLENVATLTARGRTADAFELLRQVESQLPATERGRFLSFFFALGRALGAAGDPKIEAELDAKAKRVVETEGAFGAAVHYLVDRIEIQRGPIRSGGQRAAHAGEAEALLVQHLELVPKFVDHDIGLVLRTLDRLQQIEDRDQVLARVDELLRRDPSLLPVWMHRARLLEARGDIDDALRSLRWIFDYVNHEEALLEFARIGGEHDRLRPTDLALVDAEVTPELRARPAAAYPLGLVEFRRGKYQQAADLLAEAQPQKDGAQLFFAGLARLQLDDGAAAAREAFAALVETCPQSPRAEAARHLEAQLAQLEAGAKAAAGPR